MGPVFRERSRDMPDSYEIDSMLVGQRDVPSETFLVSAGDSENADYLMVYVDYQWETGGELWIPDVSNWEGSALGMGKMVRAIVLRFLGRRGHQWASRVLGKSNELREADSALSALSE